MAVQLATAYVQVLPSTRGFPAALRRELGPIGQQSGRETGQQFGAGMTGALRSSLKAIPALVGGALVVKGVSSAFGFAKDAVFGFNSTLENSTIAFTTMLGSGEKAKTFLDELQAFAKSTPFEFGDLVRNSQLMLGMGVSARQVIPFLTGLGDSVASVGGGADVLNNTISAFSQTMAKGTLDMGNMNQLLQGGIPSALKVLAASYHVTTGEMVKMISSGKVQSSDALPRLIKGLEEGTSATAALGGMMDKQSSTFSGALSNISDALTQSTAKALKPFFDVAKRGALGLAGWLSSPAFSQFASGVTSALTSAGAAIVKLRPLAVTVFQRLIVPAVQAAVSIFRNLWSGLQDLWVVVAPLAKDVGVGLAGAFLLAVKAARVLGDVFADVAGFMRGHATLVRSIAVAVGAAVLVWKIWTTAIRVWAIVTKAATAIQAAFDVVMAANPIMLVVIAIAALAAGLIYAYNHSARFRAIVQGAFHAVATAGRWLWNSVLRPVFGALRAAWRVVGDVFGAVGRAIAAAFHAIGTAARWVWDHLIRPVFGWITGGIRGVRDVADSVGGAVGAAFRAMGAGIKWAWDHTIGPIINVISSAIHGVIDAVNGLLSSGPRIDAFGQRLANLDTNALNNMPTGPLPSPQQAGAIGGATPPSGARAPRIATGGMTTGQTFALVGDNPSGQEVVLPMDSPRTIAALSTALAGAGAGGSSGPLRVAGGRVELTRDSSGRLEAWIRDLIVDDAAHSATIGRMSR